MDIATLVQQQHQTLDGNHQGQREQDHVNGTVVSAEGHAVDRFCGEAGCSAKEISVVAPDNDSVGDSSTQCSDVINDDHEEEETDVEESGAGGWIMNPPVSTIVQQHQAFDTTNGYIALPNPESSNFSNVRVKDSSYVHLGNEVNYNGPVTIHVNHVVYANSSPTQDASKLDASVSDNTSNLSTNKNNGAPNGCIFPQNTKLNKVIQWLWTWKHEVLSCVITLILLAIVVPITVHFTHQSDASVSPEIPTSSIEDPDKVSPLSGYYKPTKAIQTTTTVDRVSHNNSGEFKVICYFTNWAWYRPERFVPEDIDSDLCTHVLYAFSHLDGSSLTMKSNDPWSDIDNKFYEKVTTFKAKGLKVLISLGGWYDSTDSAKYSRLVNSPPARRRFITQVLDFIEKYGFEGLDLDWDYPVCWQVDCNKGPESDKQSFAELVKELSNEFKPRGLLLSAAVSRSKMVIDAGYDVPILSKYLDWISVMMYDFHGQWDKKTGHVAPLYSLPNDWEPTFNTNFSIHYWIEKGANPKKLIMGAPLYGQSFSLAERNVHGLNAPTYSGGEPGEATRLGGFLSYYEICERTLKKGWTVVQDKDRRIGPYAYKGDQWVGFDDAQQIKLKAELIKKLDLGGGMLWALDLDDFRNKCGCEPSPLLRTMNRVLRNYPKGPLCPITEGAVVIDVSQTDIESITTISQNVQYTNPLHRQDIGETDIGDETDIGETRAP